MGETKEIEKKIANGDFFNFSSESNRIFKPVKNNPPQI